jgi:hypothetical protein
MFVYNPKKPDVPALTVRIVSPPQEYFQFWITDVMADAIGHPELEKKSAKRWLSHDENRKIWDSDAYYDDLKNAGYKPKWGGEIAVQIVPPSGQLTGEEQVYLISLPATSLIEFKGTSKNPEKGAEGVSEYNFIHKLAMLGAEQAPDGSDPNKAALDALTALTLGLVIAEIRYAPMKNDEMKTSWSVMVWEPVHIAPLDTAPALEAGDISDDSEADPF